MDYKAHITLTIWSLDGSKAVTGYKELTLPFVPFVGLRLMERHGPSQPIVSVAWSDNDQMFFCHVEDREVETGDLYNLDLKFLVETAKRNGWSEFGSPYDVRQ